MKGTKAIIAIAGNIGAGKSTLARLLAKTKGWEAHLELANDNPYLADFYLDMQRWSFHSQIFFLARRLRQQLALAHLPKTAILDRTLYEDAEVFARNLYLQGLMSPRDYQTYNELYQAARLLASPPTLLIYLRASVTTLLKHIYSRGRHYERSISPQYLRQLNSLYEEWIERFDLSPILVLPMDELDFVLHPEEAPWAIHQIVTKLYQLGIVPI